MAAESVERGRALNTLSSEHPIIDGYDVLVLPDALQFRTRRWWQSSAGILRVVIRMLWWTWLIVTIWHMSSLRWLPGNFAIPFPVWFKILFTLAWISFLYYMMFPPRMIYTLFTVRDGAILVKEKRVGEQTGVEFKERWSILGFSLIAAAFGSQKRYLVYRSINPFAIRKLRLIASTYLVHASVSQPGDWPPAPHLHTNKQS